jgi:hypothetical protein
VFLPVLTQAGHAAISRCAYFSCPGWRSQHDCGLMIRSFPRPILKRSHRFIEVS